ncbi:MAG: uroporphyrinogen decarboxylase family protein [Deltaproteobacteria bacterium]|jgi:uroporphyrinogen decarboxylase|nr:uroporphyrinogen decarboxylase family protein [Deltaproteobacteria bacterium]
MHKDDQMTPNERLTAFGQGQDVDRVPILPFLATIGVKASGMSLRDMRANAANEAKVQIDCYRRLGHDCMTVDYGLHGLGIALGSQVNDPEYGVPVIQEFVLEDLKNLDSLDMTKTERKNDPELRQRFQAAELMLEAAGDECGVDVTISGPFTAAASVCPASRLLRALIRDPENVHRLIRLCTDAIINICKDLHSLGLSFTLCDPVASGTVLKKQNYIDFVFPYTKRIVDELHEIGASVGYHICGNTNNIIEPMVDAGVDLLSLDNMVDMATAKEKVGKRICLVGNVDPIGVMTDGSPADVDQSVKECFRKAHDSPCGFILATGCDIPHEGSLENLDQFMASGRKYGQWPLQAKLFG